MILRFEEPTWKRFGLLLSSEYCKSLIHRKRKRTITLELFIVLTLNGLAFVTWLTDYEVNLVALELRYVLCCS